MNIGRILLATDGSTRTEGAEAYAFKLAELWGATLTVVSVLEFAPGLDPESSVCRVYLAGLMMQATEDLARLKARAAGRGITVHTRIETGIPSEQVLAAAAAEEVDVIIVGTAGKTGLAHVLLGSTAERIIQTAPCPVLAVRIDRSGVEHTGGSTNRPASLDRIVVPVDFSDCSLDALEYAAAMAQRAQASVMLLHVMEPVFYGLDFTVPLPAAQEHKREAFTERLAGLVAALNAANVKSESLIRGGLPRDSILDAARAWSADLIVMGTHGRRGLSHAFYGSVVESVLRQSHCPILAVRSPKFHQDHRRVVSAQPAVPMNP
ncbi:MAG: universal stress protein [Nitrospira sp.]|nr:universal stress protein [Nitrospira sp.]MBH0182174.1 universal stress protein [Nitrospira sp.]MBH0186738.1 universal stress protein [Nitrospira sp.]